MINENGILDIKTNGVSSNEHDIFSKAQTAYGLSMPPIISDTQAMISQNKHSMLDFDQNKIFESDKLKMASFQIKGQKRSGFELSDKNLLGLYNQLFE